MTSGDSRAAERLSRLIGRIRDRSAPVGIVGLGYVGLPLAEVAHRAGFSVIGYDVDPVRVSQLLKGESPFRHLEQRLQSILAETDRFQPGLDPERLAQCDVVLIAVPTPLGRHREPDLDCVRSAGEAVARILRPGQLVVLESTTYPGTTREVLLPILEQSGLREGHDYFVAYSPEREDPGRDTEVRSIPKVLGALSERGHEAATEFYGACFDELVPVSSAEVAEACKLLENIYRSVNIALVNEMKTVFARLGLDVWEVIAAASTKPYGFQPFHPGPGLGGHCIPVDPFYLSWKAKEMGSTPRFIELAGEINAEMPRYVFERLVEALNAEGKAVRGAQVLLVGVAYKRNIDDLRESPALDLWARIEAAGGVVTFHDPHVPEIPGTDGEPPRGSCSLATETLSARDAVVIVTDHDAIDFGFIAKHATLIVDTRNACDPREVRGSLWRA